MEKLSSEYRINRAGDDAAGLAISEKMRAQITGLGRAKRNSQEGINLIQTGEGALQEVQDMLNRALYLAGESANGTYADELDRENLQKELEQLCGEIDRITGSANFNGIKLFQDQGVGFERSLTDIDAAAVKFQEELEKLLNQWSKPDGTQTRSTASKSNQAQTTQSSRLDSGSMTLEELADNTDPDKVNIVYIEHDAVSTTQTPEGTTGTQYVTENGVSKSLNTILEKEIVPNTVQQLLENYSAFSYLKGSSIGK